MIEKTIDAECGDARTKAENYDKLRRLLTASQTTAHELAGQLHTMQDVDAERVRLVAENAVLSQRWTTLESVLVIAGVAVISISTGVVIGLVAF